MAAANQIMTIWLAVFPRKVSYFNMKIKGTININVDLDLGDLVPSPIDPVDPIDPIDPIDIPNFPSIKNGPLPEKLLVDSEWYRDISSDEVDPVSGAMLQYMNYRKEGSLFGQYWIHPDFGGGSGIPYSTVENVPDTNLVPIPTIKWPDESDKLDGKFSYPIPLNAAVETASDKHCLIYDNTRKKLFELFSATPFPGIGWKCGSASIWDIALGDEQRTLGHTSACAAGISMTVGLLKYDEVSGGMAANHALMFSTPNVDPVRIANPARHWVSVDTEQPSLPMLGTRVRLKSSFNISAFTKYGPVCVGILLTLQKYGAICVDRSGNIGFGLLGAQDSRWINGGGTNNDVAILKKDPLRNNGFLENLEVIKSKVLIKP